MGKPMVTLFIFLVAIYFISASNLEAVTDDELVHLVKNEKYVVVLFTKKDCEQCENYENELLHLREDLVDALNAWVVKAHNSQLVKLYNPTKEPALVFFRHGVPLLYDGPLNDDAILHMLTQNKDPAVKELSDDSFEHLTQASSGATTGDWFVMFYTTDCVDCVRLQATWEAVGAKLKTRMNVARVNKQTVGAVTGRRFDVRKVPSFILFRHGNMYRFNLPKYDVMTFVSFATDWYKNARHEKVPVPKTPFDDLTQMIADYIRDSPLFWQIVCLILGLAAIYTIVRKLRSKSEKPKQQPKKTEPKKDEKSKKSK